MESGCATVDSIREELPKKTHPMRTLDSNEFRVFFGEAIIYSEPCGKISNR
jgi:hypothetical protein